MKKIVAIFNLLLLAWCSSPWQLLCLDHDHFLDAKKVESIAHNEDDTSFHGCDLDYFFGLNNLTFFQFHLPQVYSSFTEDLKIEIAFGDFINFKGRAPPVA